VSTEERTCNLSTCSNTFVPKVYNQSYCSPDHRRLGVNETRRVGKFDTRTCEYCGIEYTPRRFDQRYCSVQHSAQALNESRYPDVEREKAKPNAEVEDLKRELSLYEREWKAKPRWLQTQKKERERYGTLIAFLSDTHYGEVVIAKEMADYNAYNLDIAEQRTKRFFERTMRVAKQYLAGVTYDGIVLALGGDLVSGDIHEELEQTNEMSTYETVEWAVPRLRAGIELWLEEFGQVHVVSAPGNHGRNTKKPRHKKRSANNADTHIARLLAGSMDGVDGVTFDVPRSLDASFEIYGRRFALEHGDEARGGNGQVGAMGPVKIRAYRRLLQTSMEGAAMDYLLVGHFHQLVMAPQQGFVMNGSLKGYDEYARAKAFKPEPPQQALMVMTPEHGLTVCTPLFVGNREAEGW
jgi:predicted MPP superfamily phosphohydrolase